MYVSRFMFITLALQGEGPKWEKARTMQAKMGKTRGHVESRITALTDILAPPVASASSVPSETPQQSTLSASSKPSTASPPQNSPQPPPQPPSYEEATLPPPSYRQTLTSDNLGAEARLPRSHTSDSVTSVTSGEAGEILFSMGEVQVRYGLLLDVLELTLSLIGQVFHVSPGGEVTTPSYPETLHVIRLDRAVDKAGTELPPAFIEVGDWTYPLVRGKSPIMKSNYGKTVIVTIILYS